MAIIKNALTYGFGFNVTAAGPVDSRMRVNYLTDLTSVWGTSTDGVFTPNPEAPVYAGMQVIVNEQNKAYILKQQVAEGYTLDNKTQVVKNGLVYNKADDAPIAANPTNINNWVPVGTDFSGDISDLSDRVDVVESILDGDVINVTPSGLELNADTLRVKINDKNTNALTASPSGLYATSYDLSPVENPAEGYASQYVFTKHGIAGDETVTINIPKDQVLKSAEILSVTEENLPYTGAKVGDKYIKFEFQNNNTPQYLAVQDLVDVYTADETYIKMSEGNVITLDVAAVTNKIDELLNINATAATVTGLSAVLVGSDGKSGLVADVAKNTEDIGGVAEALDTAVKGINSQISGINTNISGLAGFQNTLKAEGIINRVDNTVSHGINLTSTEVGNSVVAKINVDIDTLAAAVIEAADIPAPIASNIAVSAFGATYTENTNVQAVLESLDSRIKAAVSGGVTSVVAGAGINVSATDANNPTVSVKTSDLVATGSALTVSDNKIDICWSEL